ncbi:proto-oncogene tyrosine-protein kinase ROS isoform X3 [Chironomus tepperi]|uniref:proto-oncogene tyrosine-protein kinase ROS isoform X3 n=1 Tax=Chironomus tepperi TaxID=113505 RepID=UPI00391EF1DF
MKYKLISNNKSCNNNNYYKNKCVIILIILILCIITKPLICSAEESSELETPPINNFVEKCEQKCKDQNRTQFDDDDDDGDTLCKSECTMKQQCDVGCTLWESALDSSCQRVCNKTAINDFDNRQIYCIKGCNEASNFYFLWIKQEVQSPMAPALIPDSLTSTSLSLEWSVPSKFSELAKGNLFKKTKNETYFVQCYEDYEDDWKLCGKQTIYENSTIRLENIHPYTKYKFRIALLLSENEAIYSEPSVVISTNEEGIPESEPIILQAGAVDQTRIMVSWKSGLRNNGPILKYALRIDDLVHGYNAIKEVDPSNDTNYYIFEKLSPERNYSIQIRTRNARGVGPFAEARTMTAPYLNDGASEDPKLILATEYKIVSQGKDFLMAQPTTFYATNTSKISGIALDVRKKLIFVAEENGCIYQASLDISLKNEKKEVICQKTGLNFKPSLLSVDWLNDQLYIMGEMTSNSQHQSIKSWSISRCDYDGKKLIVAVGGLNEKPAYIEVDPYNGYLFWVITGESASSDGLFKLDLGEISNGIKHETKPNRLIAGTKLGAFVVEPTRFRLLVPYQNDNTIMAVSLNGHIEDIRKNTQSPLLHSVKSLVQLNGLFYWTNGIEYRAEEYHEKHNVYYHNSYNDATNSTIVAIRVNSSYSQPIPIPLNPPKSCQSLLSSNQARISWETPEAFGEQGKGAFKNWNYKLEISSDSDTRKVENITGNSFLVENLEPNKLYSFKVAAYTSGGSGQWSKEFKAKTLKSSDERHLIWASNEGLMQSDVTGENIITLISKEELGDVIISDVTWFEDLLYIVANSTLRFYNRTSGVITKFDKFDNVVGLAVDWIGRRLYWSNPSQQIIQHSQLDGEHDEPLSFSATVREIKIDSLRGNIYYSTGLTIESCRLNGKNERKYFRVQPYSGKLVMGLTLDMDNQIVYWIVRSHLGSSLFSAKFMDLMGEDDEPIEYKLTERNLSGPLTHFSDRLVWRQNDKTIVFGDIQGKNLAFFENEKLNGLTCIVVIDKTHHQFPDNVFGEVSVIPEQVSEDSIQIIGTYKFFNITWKPVKNVNYGKVYYDIRVQSQKIPDVTSEQQSNVFQFPTNNLEPYTKLEIYIKAFTSWGSSIIAKRSVFSPPGYPSAPINPRVYTRHLHRPMESNVQVSAIFRWSLPKQPNGKILGYKVRCSLIENNVTKLVNNKTVTGLEHTFDNLKKDTHYIFEVQAYTEVGDGNSSESIYIRTDAHLERPVPKILVSTQEEILEVDLDLQQSKLLQSTRNPIVAFTHIAHEQKLYWFDDNNELISYNIETRESIKLISTKSTVQAMTIDWVERVLYWSQIDDNKGVIYSYNLNKAENVIYKPFNDQNKAYQIIDRENVISDLVVSPFDRKLFWIEKHEKLEEESGIYYLDLEKNEVKMLFEENEECLNMTTTTMSPNPGSLTFATTPILSENSTVSNRKHESILIFEMGNDLTRQFAATDVNNKKCIDFGKIYIAERTNLAKDSNKVYWINEDLVYAREDFKRNSFSQPIPAKSNRLLAFYQQYFPKKRCLIPINRSKRVKLLSSTDTTLKIELPKPELPEDCKLKSVPIKYTIIYSDTEFGNLSVADPSCLDNGCRKIQTYNRIETIEKLKPFTHYSIMIALSSVFDQSNKLQYGEISDFLTDSGTPSPPRNISAIPLSFNEISVSWLRPKVFNAPRLTYHIHWETEHHKEQTRNNQQKQVSDLSERNDNSISDEYLSTIIKVSPNQQYKIWVRANSKNDTFSESEKIYVLSYPEPQPIKLMSNTSTSMIVQWIPPDNVSHFDIQYSRQDSYDDVHNVTNSLSPEHPNSFLVDSLEPKTKYNFSISIRYINSNRTYRWLPPQKIEFETDGDVPSAPGKPVIEFFKDNVYKIVWNASKENGAPIIEYVLESKKIFNPQEYLEKRARRSVDDSNDINQEAVEHEDTTDMIPHEYDDINLQEKWTVAYNGVDTHYIATELEQIDQHVFRVKGRNSYGWGHYSQLSDLVNSTQINIGRFANGVKAESSNFLMLLLSLLLAFLVIFMCVTCLIVVVYRNRREKKFREEGIPIPDFELSTLRDLQLGDNMILNNRNILYNHFYGPFLNPEIKHLPQIHQNQIIVTDRCLGKGAFGEVWSGVVKNDDGSEELVAIKTLHKGANDVEKREFLQEAQLMSNFKHDHILRLIGVCLNQNECLLYIVMELMESGDLLSFLRNNRPALNKPSPLKLLDLMSMCVDVASGCRYLEEMHFVHRDLAARNCLVKTAPDSNGLNLVVKIGDFGLTRDIYKNDYYRKEGEGLLPVRWMSPESLVDGVFTSQSDIWSFGVLMWEVMTLGQQPYPARTNIEVLQYVRSGGRLSRPNQNCPEELYQLMTKCWNRIDQRPTFRYCLEVLSQLQNNCMFLYPDLELSFPNDISYKYVSSDDSSILNEKLSSKDETSGELMSGQQPKYLELMYDENDERNIENMCEAPLNYSDNNQNNNNNNNNNNNIDNHQGTIKDEGYEIPISFDNLDINANNELNSNLSKSRTLSNSSTVSHKSEPNQINHGFYPIALESCKRSSLILERDHHSIYPPIKIISSGPLPQIKHHQSGWV